ncbi:hypothetical protein CK203_062582 [Vitis vinifera]|uniref:Uncharacterized protein n=1 Tax=Vitis vinifera TaxID=29760 RepID=A0A438FQE0_VITVI|nr:hypothetical protein CK203_062582 [Vitis vinifera]
MSTNKEAGSSSSSRDAHAEKSVDKLNVGGAIQRWAPIPPPVAVQGIPSLHSNSSNLHPPQYDPGADGMQHSKHAVQPRPLAARVLFVYSLKKGKNDIFSMVAHLPSLQLVTELPDLTKGGAKGHVLVRGAWVGLLEHQERPFSPNRSLVLPGPDKRGHVVEWVEKASFARLNKLFEITATERHHETLLTLPKKVVHGEHYVLKDLPFYKEVQKADAQKRQALLDDREGRRKEGTLPKAPGNNNKRARVPPLPSVSSGSGRLAGLNHSGPSLSVAGRLALLVEEATSINQPGSPHPDADAAGASCAAASTPMAPPTEEMGAESQGLPPCEPSPLAFVPVKGQLQGGLVQPDDHPEGSEVEMVEENPAAPALVPDGVYLKRPSRSFSYAELEEKLKRIPPGSDVAMPSAKMFEAVEMLVSGLRLSAQKHEEELRLRLEQAKASLSAAREDNEALRVGLAEAKSREESVDSRLYEAEDEMTLLRGKVRQLRTEVSIEKKQREDLQLCLLAQKEEMEGEFAVEREELEADYQKQVDEMYFFGYRCCMKKHGIKRTSLQFPG